MESGTESKISECQTGGSFICCRGSNCGSRNWDESGRESNNTVGKSETVVQAQKADDVKTIPEEHSETEQDRKKALEDMKWKKEMEERVQEILESVKACEKKIEETTKEENNGENKEEAEQTTEQQTEETAEKSVEEEIKQETKQEVINDPVVPE